MTTIKILTLSLIQGITELLPISSSGHLILTSKLLNFDISGDLFFIAVLHLGSILSIIVFYRKVLFQNLFTKKKFVFYLKLLLASIPAALAGFFLEDYIASTLHDTSVIAISLIAVGILFIIFENIKLNTKKQKPQDIPLWKMVVIGLGQVLALIPGTSRSGATTLTGMLVGLEKYSAFEFSFILGVPIILGSSLFEIFKMYTGNSGSNLLIESFTNIEIASAILLTFVVGYLCLLLVKKFKKSKWLTVFGIYRIVLGIAMLLFAI